jgi:hypothetical protein
MPFGSLWLPVVVSAVAVFVASALAHMVLKYHRNDFRALPDEDAVAEAMRKSPPAPGQYVIPHCADPSKMKDPEVQARYARGPVAIVTVLRSGTPNMGKYLALWFGFTLLVAFVAAYVARHTLPAAADGLNVMRITGTVAFVGYAFGAVRDAIWKAEPPANMLREVADSVVYGVITGLVFRWLWPES